MSIPELPLPIYQRHAEIINALTHHQVIIVAGETGSGKSTQLPKICLALGRGQGKWIGHTQPRRLAARNIALRVAEELNTPLGEQVGYKVRFQDQVSQRTQIKLMTDGILLNEMQQDRLLKRYDTLIIDEAHERTLNIDFILGCLKQLLPKRPDLKVIITSATLEHQRFSEHFNNAPVIEVSGRSYPITIEYAPLISDSEEQEDQDLLQGIVNAIDRVSQIGRGDILIFLPTERDIHDIEEGLSRRSWMHTEILPLYGRLSAAQQQRVFHPGHARRIILTTNVAETSVTVPRVHYVIDSGLVRMSRYHYRSKMQRLPIEPISQASANQRAGRCGRIAPGTCIRLYAKQDFLNRPEYTEPEVLRTNLAAVILQMGALKLGDIEQFPFLDKPDSRWIQDGYRLLQELSALTVQYELSPIGKQMARLPIDPKLARMVIAALHKPYLREIVIIVSALSLPDPRERPADQQSTADQAHQRYHHPHSDFISYLLLWDRYMSDTQERSNQKARQYCRDHFLSYIRMNEWRDIAGQVWEMATALTKTPLKSNPLFVLPEQPESYYKQHYAVIHQALATGLLSHIGQWQEAKTYLGARQQKWQIFPGSALYKKPPAWVMAAELVETQQCYARCVAKIDPEWLEPLALHLIKRNYFDPHWEKQRQHVVAFEKILLYGLEIVAKRKVNYGPINPAVSRDLFIREGIVNGELNITVDFLTHNQRLLTEVEALEDRARTRGIVIDEQVLIDFYQRHLPDTAFDTVRFHQWEKQLTTPQRQALYLNQATVMQREAKEVTDVAYPTLFKMNTLSLELRYHFDPEAEDDGVSLVIPLPLLPQIPEEPAEWLVPGMLLEKITTLLRLLPKNLRRHCVPVPQYAEACYQALQDYSHTRSLYFALAEVLTRITGVTIPPDSWGEAELPTHLFMNFMVLEEQGTVLAQSRDLAELKDTWQDTSHQSLSVQTFEQQGLKTWSFGDFPTAFQMHHQGAEITVYPTLQDTQDSVTLRALSDSAEAARLYPQGVLRLLMLQSPSQVTLLKQLLHKNHAIWLWLSTFNTKTKAEEDFLFCCFSCTFWVNQPAITTHTEFLKRLEQRSMLAKTGEALIHTLTLIMPLQQQLHRKIFAPSLSLPYVKPLQDLQKQLAQLIYSGFLLQTPAHWLVRYPVYLKAMQHRLEKLPQNLQRDALLQQQYQEIERQYQQWLAIQPNQMLAKETYWWLQEYRVALFAQQLGTINTFSEKQLKNRLKI